MTDYEQSETPGREESDDLLEAQEGKGDGEDEGEREPSLPDE